MIRALNIGGGPKFKAKDWLNLDSVSGNPFELSPECVLPLADASVELVYSSHTLEHLDDPTVARVLDESRRVLRYDGVLLIKIPDFDMILSEYHRGNAAFFSRWPNLRVMTETVKNRGVKDTLAARAAQCFCGFWNKQFGHMFAGYDIRQPGAYYGPPVMTEEQLQAVMALPTPHAIAATLRAHIVMNETDCTFNHQNAWGRKEMDELLTKHRFAVYDDHPESIVINFAMVPGIDIYRDISAYYAARPI